MAKSTSSSYYESDYQTSIERVVLAEDVKFTTVDNVQGKFYIPVMTPGTDTTANAKIQSNGARTTANYVTLNIPGYMLFQFMSPTLTTLKTKNTKEQVVCSNGSKSVLSFIFDPDSKSSFTIPKGTVFLVSFLGGEFTIERTCIVGLLTTDIQGG